MKRRWGWSFPAHLIVGAILYPVWGYLYDRFARTKLLALAALIWGATTWLSAAVQTFPLFVVTRSSTGIADSSYPGLYNITNDYFEPKERGKIMGLLQIAQPLGYLVGMILALIMGGIIGWRGVFYVTGAVGFVMAIVIFFGVKEPQSGSTEPELQGIEQKGDYRFNWNTALGLFKKKSLLFLFLNCFTGVFPWQVLTFWFFRYLETGRGYDSTTVLITMVVAVLMLAAGYPIGGILGDYFFKRNQRGRLLVSAAGILIALVLLVFAIMVPYNADVPLRLPAGLHLHLHAVCFAQRGDHHLRYDAARGAQHGQRPAELLRAGRLLGGAAGRRHYRRQLIPAECHTDHLRICLDSLLHLSLLSRPTWCPRTCRTCATS